MERTAIQRQTASSDREIDALAYALYGLNEAEVAVVQGANVVVSDPG